MFQHFSARAFAAAPEPPLSRIGDTADLMSRYPDLSEVELARLIYLYRTLSALDLALMLSDEELRPELDRFSREQRSKIRTPFRQYAVLVGIFITGLIVAVWAVAVGS